ncbi:MAG: DUF5717 family protein [Lachnoclostridium sp.]|nr:DUF5717 family protein [Lachnospira sp.]MCM1247199.1 DUF5717 family protein [Lachnoclostridium sp.]MCM1534580.1 DUF5717 family protein [Clostridium sp.]
MQEMIRRILDGDFDYENGSLDFSCSKIELELSKGSTYEGSFYINSSPGTVGTMGRFIDGYVVSSDLRMECLTPEFSGSNAEVAYCFHGEHLEEGDVVKGAFSVISNRGEYYLPFVVSIEHTVLETSIGSIKNLFHFANLAKSSWREAVAAFYSQDFSRIFTGNDARFLDCYKGLSANPGNEQNVEEFLICINKKQKVEYVTGESSIRISLTAADSPYAVAEHELEIIRNGWGYTALNIECEGDFCFTEKEFLTDDDFLGNVCRLPVFIDTDRCRRGKNFGRLYLFNSYVSLTIPIEVRIGEERAAHDAGLTRKRIILQMMRAYEKFRLKKLNRGAWLKETGKLVEKLVIMDEDDIEARLFQAQLLITEERFHEAGFILEHTADLIERSGKTLDAQAAYHLYLTTLVHKDKDYVREAAVRVERIHHKKREEWRVAWLLLYLPGEYGKPAAKWAFLEKQFSYGCTSPVIYLEALALLNANPVLMRRLEEFELQIIHYGAEQDSLNHEVTEQFLYLCSRKREFSQVLLTTLKLLYDRNQDTRILQEICAVLISGGRVGPKYLEWYQKGVDAQLRITNLYEYYMMSIDLEMMQPIPKIVLMYFAYQNNLDYERSAYLYHYLLLHKEELKDLYENYSRRMEHFVIDQIQKEHINRHLAALYQEMLSGGMINEQTAENLSRLLFAHWIRVEDSRLKRLYVYQPGKVTPTEYVLQESGIWAVIYGNDYTLVFEDAYGNRFVRSMVYSLEKLMLVGKHLQTLAGFVKDSQGLNLYLCEINKEKTHTLADVERWLFLAQSEDTDDALRSELTLKLLQHYYEEDDVRALDRYLDIISPERLTMKERDSIVKYMVLQGKYKRAYEWLGQYTPYFADPKILVRLLNGMAQQEEIPQDGVFTAAALYTFRRGKYDSCILRHLVHYYQGNTKEMRDIWKAARSFEVDSYELCERMLLQMLYTGAFVGEKMEIFEYYISQGAKPEVEAAFLTQCAYDYFVKDKIIGESIFREIQGMFRRGEDVRKICKLAYLKYYSNNPKELDSGKIELIRIFLKEMLTERIHLDFFKRYGQFVDLTELEDRVIVEYHARPGGKARIHYVTVYDDGESGEYLSEYMKEVYGGVCFKEFVLFFGESIQYYIMEENDGEEQLTESGTLQRDESGDESEMSRFGLINDMIISKNMQDYDTLDNLLEEYFRREYLNGELFELM